MIDHTLQAPASPVAGLTEQLPNLSGKQLLELRNNIDQILGVEIKDLNLGEELGLLFRQGKELLEKVMPDPLTPANQKAQVFNMVKGQVDRLVATREKVYSQERFKRFESTLIKIIKMAGTEKQQETFLDLYGDYLEDKGE